MRRSLLTTVGAMAFTLAVPTAALAHHGHRHHHHRVNAKTHHAKFRLEHIGDGTGTLAPPAGTQPAAPESAGTVASYANGLLTLTLNGGSTVSGKVTNDTRLGCVDGSDDSHHGSGRDSHPDSGWDGDDHDQSASEPPCDTSLFVPGAVVRAAELRIGPGGGEFESVWLVR